METWACRCYSPEENTDEIVSYAEAINSQVVKWAVLAHIDLLSQRVNTLFCLKRVANKVLCDACSPSLKHCGIFLPVCLKEIKL